MTIAGVVLAAGAGSRFAGGEHKLLAPFRGRPLVTWAVEAARQADGIAEVIVVTGAVTLGHLLPEDVVEVPNPDWRSGQASSVRAGVLAAGRRGHDVAVVGLADSPLVPASAWSAVAAATGDIATATFDGRRRPPVRLAAAVWDDLPVDGDEGARVLLRGWPDRVREVACQGDPVDIDTLEDLTPWN
ncbi:MAG: nucleotidyltransferase family protein [Acidimicrobiia bacterium]|nr:nucleotidyltransferase family protein [Acidimicrobiia bacterium]